MADVTEDDVREMRRFLTGICSDLKRWLPEPEWQPGWQSDAARERANQETGPDGPWGPDPVRWAYTAAAMYVEAVLQCMRAMAEVLTTDTTQYVPYCLARAAMDQRKLGRRIRRHAETGRRSRCQPRPPLHAQAEGPIRS
jgi:hypothetical protein